MRRESEWSDYTRARVFALMEWESRKCPNCGNYDCLVPLPSDLRHYEWTEYAGQKYEVAQFRCLACGAADTVRRMWMERHGDEQPIPGHAAPIDGRMFVAQPVTEEV